MSPCTPCGHEVLLKYVLTRRKALNERSDVVLVAGITTISLRSKLTRPNRFFELSLDLLSNL